MAKRKRRKNPRKRRSAAQVRAFKKMIAALHAKRGGHKKRRRRRRAVVSTKRRRRRHTKEAPVARRRRKGRRRRRSVAVVRANPRRVRRHRHRARHVRRYRRNPGLGLPSMKGVVATLQHGVVDAAKAIAGKVATRFVANLAPAGFKDTLVKNLALQVGSALVVGMAARRFLGADTARMVLVGGLMAPLEAALKPVPVVGPLLGDDYLSLGDQGISSYLGMDEDYVEGTSFPDASEFGSSGGIGLYTESGGG